MMNTCVCSALLIFRQSCCEQGRCAAVTMMDSHLAFLPAMEPEVLEQLLAQQRSQGDPTSPQGIARTLGSTVGNAILMDLHKLGIKRVRASLL